MTEREEEVSVVTSFIHNMCAKYNIVLMPMETKKGIKYVGIHDNITGKDYAMIKGDSNE